MAVAQTIDGMLLGDTIRLDWAAPPSADVVFLPTDSRGVNTAILSQLGLDISILPSAKDVKAGYAIHQGEGFAICFVDTAGMGRTAQNLQANLGAALNDRHLANAKSIWLPLMGAGADRLTFAQSLKMTIATLRKTSWISRSHVRIVISLPPKNSPEADEALLKAIDVERKVFARQNPKITDPAVEQPLPFSESSRALLNLAAALRQKRKDTAGPISTSLIFFALSEARSVDVPGAVSGDQSAGLLSAALRDRVGASYDEAWASYFLHGRQLAGLELPETLPALTSNIGDVIGSASRRAEQAGRSEIETDDLIEGLLTLENARFHRVLDVLRICPQDLLSDYRDMRTGQVMMTLHNDVASTDDKLGYQTYADAIAGFVVDATTLPPLSISIQAPWGAGKSSLMHLIREQLDPKVQRDEHKPKVGDAGLAGLTIRGVLNLLNRPSSDFFRLFSSRREDEQTIVDLERKAHRVTIWFNAWKYETSEQVWAGLVDAIVSQVSDRLPPVEREKFLLRLQLARIDDGIVRQKIYDRVINIWWAKVRRWVLIGAAAIITFLGFGAAPPSLFAQLWGTIGDLQPYGYGGALAAQIILSLYLIFQYVVTGLKTRAEPAKLSLADYIRVPDYNKSVGEIHQIHADLRRVLAVTPSDSKAIHSPLVIFIDDLDRCSPTKVAGVVEGVSMLLADDTYRCMFVIGMDPQMIAAALEKAHEDVRDHLPSYERAVPLGWRFMDKFIQLPFTIPPSRRDRLDDYLASLGAAPASTEPPPQPGAVEGSAGAVQGLVPPAPERADPLDAEFGDSGKRTSLAVAEEPTPSEALEVGRIIRLVAKHTGGNPREVKRMVNMARLYLALRNARRNNDPSWRWPNLDQYARWIVLTLHWPDMMRWLQWGADEALWTDGDINTELVARRLGILEESAQQPEAKADDKVDYMICWRDKLKDRLTFGEPEKIDWTGDLKLREFFRREGKMDKQQRLSAAAGLGFW